eukprot:EST48969.1 Hypothetical protein SS50377_10818 [Spironucleus salmonicida]
MSQENFQAEIIETNALTAHYIQKTATNTKCKRDRVYTSNENIVMAPTPKNAKMMNFVIE